MLKINIHYSFLFLILIGLFAGRIVEILIFILIILLHELSHAITALLLGKKVKKITITMIGGVVEIKGHYSTFLKEFLINISGILMNIFLESFILQYSLSSNNKVGFVKVVEIEASIRRPRLSTI